MGCNDINKTMAELMGISVEEYLVRKKEMDKEAKIEKEKRLKKRYKYEEKKTICPVCKKEFLKTIYFNKPQKIKEYLNICSDECYKKKPESDKICKNLRARFNNKLRSIIKNPNLRTKDEHYDLIGCSIQEFKDYIEYFFKYDTNMNWNNYGDYWEIDHIIPLDIYIYLHQDQQEKAFHYTNCRAIPKVYNRFLAQKICIKHSFYKSIKTSNEIEKELFEILTFWTKDKISKEVVIDADEMWKLREQRKQEEIERRERHYDEMLKSYEDSYDKY